MNEAIKSISIDPLVRADFSDYLEKSGVSDAIAMALCSLYEEANKPEDALDYICKRIGMSRLEMYAEELKSEAEQLRNKLNKLKNELDILQEATRTKSGVKRSSIDE